MESVSVKVHCWALLAALFLSIPILRGQVYPPSDDPGPRPEGVEVPPDASRPGMERFLRIAPLGAAPELVSVPGAWSPQGPGPISGGQVEGMTNKFVCGAIHAVITHPTDPNIVYIGAVNGGVWKTTNATAASPSWTTTTSDMPSLSIGALAFDPLDATMQTVWAGTGRFSSFSRFGGSRAGLLKTTDGGASWTVVDGGGVLTGKNISGIVVRGNTILVSVNTADNPVNTNLGVWRSTNGGTSFTQMAVADGSGATGLPAGVSYDIVSAPSAPSTVYTCIAIPSTPSARGIYKSTDLGATWTRVSTTAMNNRITSVTSNIEMSVGNVSNVVLGILESGAPVGIFHSGDAGSTWQEMDYPTMPVTTATVYTVTNATNASPIVITTSAPHGYANNNYVEVTGVTGNTAANGLHQITVVSTTTFSLDFSVGNGAYVSGGTAKFVTSMNPRGSKGPEDGAPDEIAGGQGSIHFSIIAHPTNSNLLFTGGDRQDLPFPNFINAVNYSGNLWRGDASVARNGLSPSSQWEHLTHSNSVAGIPGGGTSNNSSPHADSRDMAIDADGQLVEVDDGGIFRRTSPGSNAGAWTSMAGNLQVAEAHSVVYDTVSDVIITGNQDNGTSVQNSPDSFAYTAISTADGGDVAVAPNPANPAQSIRYSSFQNLGSFRKRITSSANTLVSQSFPALAPQGGAPAISGQFVTPIEINAINANRLLIGASNGIYESLDQGATVSRISTLSPNDGLSGGRTMSYGGRKDAIDNAEVVHFGDGSSVYRRVDAGDTPAAVAGYTGSTVRGIVVDPEDYDHLFAIDNNQVFRSTDGGDSFTDITGDIPAAAKDFRCLEFIRDGADWAILVGSLRGVYAASSNAPTDWGVVGTDLPNAYVWDMDYDASDNLLVVGTLGRGAWKFSEARSIVGFKNQTITFAPITDKLTTDTLTLTATGGDSGNPVTFAVTSGPAVIGPLNLVSFTGAGSVTITASQAGNGTYSPATDVSRTFTVTKATATVTLGSLSQTYDGTPRAASATTDPAGKTVVFTYDGAATAPTNAGSYGVVGTIVDPIYQGSATGTLEIAKAAQTITFAAIPNKLTTDTVTLSATGGGSGNLVTFAVTEGPASIADGVLSFTGSGEVTVTASQLGNANYEAATSVSRTFTVTKATATVTLVNLSQIYDATAKSATATTDPEGKTVTFTYDGVAIAPTNAGSYEVIGTIDDLIYQGSASGTLEIAKSAQTISFGTILNQLTTDAVTLTATGGGSGNPVTFAVTSGPATINNGVLSFATSGEVTITASQAGNANYENATPVSRTFTVTKATATVALANLSQTYDGTPKSATATTDPVGKTVVFTYDAVATAPTNAGSYAVVCTIDDAIYQGSATGTLQIAKAAQAITFAAIPDKLTTETVTLSATGGGSGNPVTFAVTEGSATITDGVLSFTGAGNVTVTASQTGNANYEAASTVSRTFTVTKATATVTLGNLSQTYDGTPKSATATTDPAGKTVTFTYEGTATAPTNAGTYAVVGTIDDAIYQGSSTGTLEIAKAAQVITFAAIPNKLTTDSVTLSSTGGGSGNPVTFAVTEGPATISSGVLSFNGAGSVTITASQTGNANYEAAATVSRSFTVTKASATVTLGNLEQTHDGTPKTATATTDPVGKTVSLTYEGSSTAPTNAGSYPLVGTIDDAIYQGSATGTLAIAKAAQTITFSNPGPQLANATVNLSATGGGSGNPVTFAVTAGSASISSGILSFTGPGSVTIATSQAGNANYESATPVSHTFTVSKAAATITLSRLHQVADGTAREIVVTTVPADLEIAVTYNGAANAPVAPGSYAVVATSADDRYDGSASGTFVVDDPARSVRVPGGSLPALSALGDLTVPTFSIGAYEVTASQWTTVVTWAEANAGYDFAGAGAAASGDRPVTGISWFDAAKWCNARTEWENALLSRALAPAYRVAGAVYKIGAPTSPADLTCDFGAGGYRLPTAAEWEYAARGGAFGTPSTYPGGNTLDDLGWYVTNSNGAVQPAGGKTANSLGLYDLAGNAAEWTWDAPTGSPAQRLLRGGAWRSAASASELTALSGETASLRPDRAGFRIVRSISLALAAALDASDLDWETGGDEAWSAQITPSHDGSDAAESGAVAPGQSSWLETTVTGPANLRFRWEASQRGALDLFRLETGTGEPILLTGSANWSERLVELPEGDHTLRWVFVRDAASTGTSRVRLDAVSVTPASPPTVTTTAASSISGSGATLGGNVTADGGRTVTARGVVYATTPDPTLTSPGALAAASGGTGTFSVAAAGLAAGTTYHARAYATNNLGTRYGAEIVFTTDESVDLAGGTVSRQRVIESGDRHVFHFFLASPRHADFSTIGGAALRAELFDEKGTLLATFTGNGDFSLRELLFSGDYELHVYRGADGGDAQGYTLTFDVATEAVTLPDAAVGPSVLAQSGVGRYGSRVGQVLSLASRNAVSVFGVATFRNGGTLPDELILSGTGGSAFFAVSYFGETGNVTAQMLTGTLRTTSLVEGDEPVEVTVSVVPNRKKLSKKKRIKKKKKIVTLKRTHVLLIRAKSDFDPLIGDEAEINVRTF